jgi:enamine deaminase RidA (YjgF/YER057c/UK114 family)
MSVQRKHIGSRMSEIVIHNNTVYLAGQIGTPGSSVAEQTREALAEVERLLAEVGSSSQHILQAIIWLADIADFAEMNSVWDNWVAPGHAPARACSEARLADPGLKFEVIITAAIPVA